uniref:II-FBPL precursor n=1 Tax=Xenopus tropicalis TaxID=8364 RepID=L7N3P4_XENTR
MKCFVVLLVCISIGWVHSCKFRQEESNLIKGATAKQSSTSRPDYSAERAFDGISDYNMMRHPCAETRREHSPWWQLDLKHNYKVDSVVIVSRRDCCFHTLLGAQIRIGNSPDNNNPVCGTITDVFRPINLCCNGMEGRYVSVVIPGRVEQLTICEVKVYSEGANRKLSQDEPAHNRVNIARSGEATQSSTYGPMYNAAAAIDGNTNSNMMAGSCSLTGNDNPAWWQLNLKKRYKVGKVVIVNRGDCCSERLLGAEVRVGDSADNNNPVCGAITDASQATITLPCKGMKGRYVSVVIPGRNEYLTLCEVEVYGQEAKPDAVVNLAKSGRARQSSTYRPEYNAAAAIDGDKGTNIFQHPCSHTNPDNPAWWQLDLTKKYNIESVVIVNRGDCCSERLRGAEIRVGIFPFINSPVCDTVTDVSKPTITLNCNGMVGQYISVVIPGRQEYLTLCEVEVYGQEI